MIMIIILILYFSLTKELIINKELTIMILIIIPVGVRRGIVCLMGRKNSSALAGIISRDGVSIKRPVGGNHETHRQTD